MSAQRIRTAQQRFGELLRELSRGACLCEDVFQHVGEVPDGLEPDHCGPALDRMGVTEHGIDGVGVCDTTLEREQRVDQAVESLIRLVAEELEELRFGIWLRDDHAAAAASSAKSSSTSMTPMSPESSSAAPASNFD